MNFNVYCPLCASGGSRVRVDLGCTLYASVCLSLFSPRFRHSIDVGRRNIPEKETMHEILLDSSHANEIVSEPDGRYISRLYDRWLVGSNCREQFAGSNFERCHLLLIHDLSHPTCLKKKPSSHGVSRTTGKFSKSTETSRV